MYLMWAPVKQPLSSRTAKFRRAAALLPLPAIDAFIKAKRFFPAPVQPATPAFTISVCPLVSRHPTSLCSPILPFLVFFFVISIPYPHIMSTSLPSMPPPRPVAIPLDAPSSTWDRLTSWVSENKAAVYTIAGVAVVVTGAGAVYYLNSDSVCFRLV